MVGFSHSGWGLQVPAKSLPTYDMPKFDGIGANEYIVDVVHDACDFISAVDTPVVWELNIWYHTLNCGYTARISGETDFPCIYGDKVGLGRAYVKLAKGRAARLRPLGAADSRRPQLLLRRLEPPVRLHGRTASAWANRALAAGQRVGRQERQAAGDQRASRGAAGRKARRENPQDARSIKSPTGTSSVPASATRNRCRSN